MLGAVTEPSRKRGPRGRGRAARRPPLVPGVVPVLCRATDMDLRLTRARKRSGRGGLAACLHAGAGDGGGGCSGRVSIVGRGGAERGARGAERRAGRRQSASGPRPRGRRLCIAVRRAGVSPRAPGGGGEPRAARPRAHVTRSRSAPSPPPSEPPRAVPIIRGRRARSLAAPNSLAPPAPRLKPVFLWARQHDGTVQEVHCEDYDPRNRIRIARTATGWRVIPRTETYDAIRVPQPPARPRIERRRRRRYGTARRRRPEPVLPVPDTWLAPDLESHIPSHTIAVQRVPVSPPPPPSPPVQSPPPPPLEARPPSVPEPTPLDNLLAVAELEFNQQRGEEALELELQAGAAQYGFLPDEQVAADVMSFELGSPKASDDMFYDRKSHGGERGVTVDEDAFRDDIVSHEELFESISEAHYLPELSGPHDEALLESLVEKGCEDNQILGQALDKLAHLVHGSGEYGDEEEDMLLSGAPVADIIDRLEQSLESPTRSSMTAAQGLLHLHHIGDHQQNAVDSYMDDEVFAPDPPAQCTLDTLTSGPELEEANEVNHYDYEQNAEKRLENNGEPAEVMYTEQVPDMHETYDDKEFDDDSQTSQTLPPQTLPQQTDVTLPDRTSLDGNCEEESDDIMREEPEEQDMNVEQPEVDEHNNLENNEASTDLISEISETCVKVEPEVKQEAVDNSDKPTDLSISVIEDDDEPPVPSTNSTPTAKPQEKPEEFPRDLTIHRRLPTPHASPRIEIPRAPSRESDAMQSPQPSGIPAISSPEVFNAPPPKQKQPSFLESLYASTSPKMYTSEVTITKQQYEPLNLGKHRKSASPTVSSCSDEIRKQHKDYGEPQEKRSKRDPLDDLGKISKLLQTCDNLISDKLAESKQKKPEQPPPKPSEAEPTPSSLQQLKDLMSNKNFNIPNPLLVPKDKLNDILMAPGTEIPALLMQRPELRLPEILDHPTMVRDPDILVISLEQLENIVSGSDKRDLISPRHKDSRSVTKSSSRTEKAIATTSTATPDPPASAPASVASSSGNPKPIPSMGALADDIDAATSAALNQMLWLPYLSQLEAMAACSQNMDFLKALNSSGYTGTNYAELSQMFNHPSRFMNQASFPGMPGTDYDSRMQFAMWQEAMNHANAATPQRHKSTSSVEAQLKEMASKTNEFPSPYVHSAKASQSKSHSAARTSPIANNYSNSQRSMSHNPFLQNMYPGMNPNVRPNMPLPGLQIPYFNPNMMGSQRSPRTAQQKSPTSPYYPNNNYLQAVKPPEGVHHRDRDRGSSSSQESPRPRISVKSLQELQQTAASARRTASGSGAGTMAPQPRRRDDRDEVGSTSDPPRLPPHHPHDPSTFHLWHPLFGNQKGYTSPWSWTTVTATGD